MKLTECEFRDTKNLNLTFNILHTSDTTQKYVEMLSNKSIKNVSNFWLAKGARARFIN